ncbi:MAG: hypothetical protein HQK99_02515 [Nitrospirae bacterium]|nr:hypothetical protein [Nitrospirota bacterium]
MDNINKDLRFVNITTLVFFILTFFNLAHHSMWRDELEAWMIVRDAVSLRSLAENMRYQGHPMLWHLIFYPVTKLTRNPASMQAVHLLIATAVAYVFLRFAPFNKLLKGLFVFGYFPFFEYAAISRGYSIGILLLFIFCAYIGKAPENRNYVVLSVILFLMCQCSALAAVIAIALGITIMLEPFILKDFSAYSSGRFYAACAIFAAGLTLSIIQMIPPADSYWYYPDATIHDIGRRLSERISFFWNVFIPIPRIEPAFWDSNIITHLPLQQDTQSNLRLIASLGLFMVSLCFVLRKRVPAVYYIFSVVGITAFEYIYYNGQMRHKGHYYFAFVTAMWLGSYYTVREFKSAFLDGFFSFFENNKGYFLAVVFSAGLIGGLIANIYNDMYPFSESRETADYIKRYGLQDMPIAGHMDYAASGVSAYIDRPFYYPTDNRTGTFMVWRKLRDERVDAFKSIGQFRDRVKADVLLVLNDAPPDDKILQYKLVLLKAFTNSIRPDENFYLYLMRYVRT